MSNTIKVADVVVDMLLNIDKVNIENIKNSVVSNINRLKGNLTQVYENPKKGILDTINFVGDLGVNLSNIIEKSGFLSGTLGSFGSLLGSVSSSILKFSSKATKVSNKIDKGIEYYKNAKGILDEVGSSFQSGQGLLFTELISKFSGINISSMESVKSNLKKYSEKIKNGDFGTNDITKFLGKLWGGDGSNLNGESKVSTFLNGIQDLVVSDKQGKAFDILKDLLPNDAKGVNGLFSFVVDKGIKFISKSLNLKGLPGIVQRAIFNKVENSGVGSSDQIDYVNTYEGTDNILNIPSPQSCINNFEEGLNTKLEQVVNVTSSSVSSINKVVSIFADIVKGYSNSEIKQVHTLTIGEIKEANINNMYIKDFSPNISESNINNQIKSSPEITDNLQKTEPKILNQPVNVVQK